ncbi:MAG: hypothetical protein OHK0011_08700 [Turneriella sp.]
MLLRFGDICLIKFPFTDGINAKKRPAVLLSTDSDGDGIFLRVTTQLDGDASLIIENWDQCGLLAPSCIRTEKFAALSLSLVDRQLGHLSEPDLAALLISLEAWLQRLRQK